MTARRCWTEQQWADQLDEWAEAGLIERTGWTGAPFLTTPEPTPEPGAPGFVEGAWFDPSAVERFLRFCLLLRHTLGKWAGASVRLFDWQVRYQVGPALGWKHPDGTRIIRTVIVLIPRKNGKSTLASVLSLYLWCADREAGAEVYAAAGDRQQARRVYDAAKAMAETSSAIRKRAAGGIKRSVMEYPPTSAIFRALSSDGGRQHGLNVSGAVIDELHVHKHRGLVDALETGTGSRVQPLVWIISTADDGTTNTIFAEKYEYLQALHGGHVDDPSTFGVVFAADPAADPFDEATWEAANPGLGLTVSRDYLRRQANRARVTPGYLNEFLRLHLNVRTKTGARWLDLSAWDAGAGLVDLDALDGRPCFAGLDLSATTDLTSLSLWFPPPDGDPDGEHVWVPFFWLPEDNVAAIARRTRVPFDRWAEQPGPLGRLLRTTEGNVVDYRAVRNLITQINRRWPITALGYDPWNATETINELADDGLVLEPVRQGYASLSPPSKALERLVLAGRVRHGGNPILRYCIDCTEVRSDENGNVRPVKPDTRTSAKRIDGTISGLNALAMHLLRSGPETKPEPRIRVIGG
ncbi:Phage terminase-like protein, large subunit, contains N-terminal HTH domain [Saccharopolyspora kobensis]|uniref:Phage terminase-like protein, large subunit, contains N-terminal HTH domain n=1 Tax=Saccharopolyspora kobensis TaxID=146035 RepID=A0A1H6E1C9_9PSEU|nr:terminase TerL endonuclease subunit [Saccharopolyspora kobensis]SEG90806.1 Phage terminase-like protein, large subunit, contains N-terminal HTH domain [Saccharopolyspora kobensis]SFD93983.1 Phage terminase-like protein, large subunit, contains N-terminal HTH domain [Saccharopolyspora kobensis]